MPSPRYPSGTGSVAAIAGHPLHPLVVPLPIGALVLTLVADIAWQATGDPFWARSADRLLLAVIVTGALAGILGLIDLMSISRARSMGIALAHGAGNVLLIAMSIVNYLLRPGDPASQETGYGLYITIASILLAGLTGWLGGELVFRHGIGVSRRIGAGQGADEEYLPSGRTDIGKS